MSSRVASDGPLEDEERERVECDEDCGAFDDPRTLEEFKAAYLHWRQHALLDGCSHAC
jgi:hypothetical protein